MKLSKRQRESLKGKFLSRCAYCGDDLGTRWHADQLEPVQRRTTSQRGKGFVPTGMVDWPERDCFENLMPACPPCNIDKHTMSLEGWRQKLENGPLVLHRNSPTYRHSIRFSLLAETGAAVVFHFEKQSDGTAQETSTRSAEA